MRWRHSLGSKRSGSRVENVPLLLTPLSEIVVFMYFFKVGNPWPLFNLFSSFQTISKILQQIYVEKYPSSIRCWDLNPQPLKHESPPITTRQGLPPIFVYSFSLFSMFSQTWQWIWIKIRTFRSNIDLYNWLTTATLSAPVKRYLFSKLASIWL